MIGIFFKYIHIFIYIYGNDFIFRLKKLIGIRHIGMRMKIKQEIRNVGKSKYHM